MAAASRRDHAFEVNQEAHRVFQALDEGKEEELVHPTGPVDWIDACATAGEEILREQSIFINDLITAQAGHREAVTCQAAYSLGVHTLFVVGGVEQVWNTALENVPNNFRAPGHRMRVLHSTWKEAGSRDTREKLMRRKSVLIVLEETAAVKPLAQGALVHELGAALRACSIRTWTCLHGAANRTDSVDVLPSLVRLGLLSSMKGGDLFESDNTPKAEVQALLAQCRTLDPEATARAEAVSIGEPDGILWLDSYGQPMLWDEYKQMAEDKGYAADFGSKDHRQPDAKHPTAWEFLLEQLYLRVLRPKCALQDTTATTKFGAIPRLSYLLPSWPEVGDDAVERVRKTNHFTHEEMKHALRPLRIFGFDFPTSEHYVIWRSIVGEDTTREVEGLLALPLKSALAHLRPLDSTQRRRYLTHASVVKFHDQHIMHSLFVKHLNQIHYINETDSSDRWAYRPTLVARNLLGRLLMRVRDYLPGAAAWYSDHDLASFRAHAIASNGPC